MDKGIFGGGETTALSWSQFQRFIERACRRPDGIVRGIRWIVRQKVSQLYIKTIKREPVGRFPPRPRLRVAQTGLFMADFMAVDRKFRPR